MGAALWRFWLIRGYLGEGLRWIEAIMSTGDAGTDASTIPPHLRAALLHGAAVLAHNSSDNDRAQVLYERCLALQRELGDSRGISHVLNNLGSFEFSRRHYERARQLLEESLAIKRSLNDERGIASSLNNLGTVAHETGQHAEAEIFFAESIRRARALGHAQGTAVALINLAGEVRLRGDTGAARALYEEAHAIAAGLGDLMQLASVFDGLGDLARTLEDDVEAEQLYMQALRLWHELGDRRNAANTLMAIAATQVHREKWHAAGVLFGAAEAIGGTPLDELSPIAREEFEPLIAAVRARLGDDSFAAAWTEGAALSFESLETTVSRYL